MSRQKKGRWSGQDRVIFVIIALEVGNVDLLYPFGGEVFGIGGLDANKQHDRPSLGT